MVDHEPVIRLPARWSTLEHNTAPRATLRDARINIVRRLDEVRGAIPLAPRLFSAFQKAGAFHTLSTSVLDTFDRWPFDYR
jgi:hypothetical protein